MQKTVVALGTFDGVHLGHRALLARAADLAHANGDEAVAFTFSNHPRELFGDSFDALCTLRRKESLIQSVGVDAVDAVPFTASFAAQSPEAFVAWLCDRYPAGIAAVVCGYDYRFGAHAAGDAATLKKLGARHGFSVEVLDAVLYGDAPCSSSRVRQALQMGDLDAANAMLARPYAIEGRVEHHRAIGRTLGFPTANITHDGQLLPRDGVYASALLLDGKLYASVTNVGCNPTVGGTERTVETHVMDASLELYEREVAVLLLKPLREERRFDSRKALAVQIQLDAEAAKKVFQDSEKSVYNTVNVW